MTLARPRGRIPDGRAADFIRPGAGGVEKASGRNRTVRRAPHVASTRYEKTSLRRQPSMFPKNRSRRPVLTFSLSDDTSGYSILTTAQNNCKIEKYKDAINTP